VRNRREVRGAARTKKRRNRGLLGSIGGRQSQGSRTWVFESERRRPLSASGRLRPEPRQGDDHIATVTAPPPQRGRCNSPPRVSASATAECSPCGYGSRSAQPVLP